MKPFRFRLLKLKEQRFRLRREHQLRHAWAEREWAARASELAAVTAERQQHLDAVATRRAGRLDLPWEQFSCEYLDRLKAEEARRDGALAEADRAREEARLALAEAARAYRTLERLEERRRLEHETEERRCAQKELDEIGQLSRRHGTVAPTQESERPEFPS